jgi:hypothetical protein
VKNGTKQAKDANDTSYMWALRAGFESKYPLVYYHYHNGRSANILLDWIKDFKGVFQTDALSTYTAQLSGFSNITLAGCNVPARRKFKDINKVVSSLI